MLEDMEVRNLSAGTQQVYLAAYLPLSPTTAGDRPRTLGPEEIRWPTSVYLTNEKQLAPATLVRRCGPALPRPDHAPEDVADPRPSSPRRRSCRRYRWCSAPPRCGSFSTACSTPSIFTILTTWYPCQESCARRVHHTPTAGAATPHPRLRPRAQVPPPCHDAGSRPASDDRIPIDGSRCGFVQPVFCLPSRR